MSSAAYLPDPDAEGDIAPSGDPFQSDSGTAFYFDEAVRVKRLNLLFHLVPYSDVLLVTGETGSGKTCILRRLLASAPDSWRVCSLQATATLDEVQLVEVLHKEFSLRPDDGSGDSDQRLRLLRESLYALRHTALVPVLAIDDAHLLTQAALALLADLTDPWQGKDKLLSVVLFAEPGINKKLIAPGLETLRARIAHTFDIPPLSEEDTGKYIQHRLRAAGLDEEGTPFTHSVIKFIHVASRGLPGRINEFARVVLQNNAQRAEGVAPSPSIMRSGVFIKYGIAVLLIVLAAVGLLYHDRLLSFAASLLPGTAAPPPAAMAPATVQPSSPTEDGAQSAPITGSAVAEAPVAVLPESAPASDESTVNGTVSRLATEPASPPSPEVAATPAPPDTAPLPGAPAEVTGPTVPPQTQQAAGGAEPTPPTGRAAATASEEGPSTTEGPVTARGPVSAADAAESPRDDAWLLAQNPAYYTLQLLVASRAQCLAYIERYGLGDAAAIFQTRSGGQAYFALVYGVYATGTDAADAGKALSDQDVKMSPWVRRMSVIQTRIHEFQAAGRPAESVLTNNNKGVTTPNDPRREAWLLEQAPETYTLQLFTGREANVLDYLKRHTLADKVAVFHPADSPERLTVVYGSYPNGPQAMQAAKELAAQLPDIKPWARSLREIQALILPQAPAGTPPP